MQSSGTNGKIENPLSEVKICGCCLGSSSSDANEIVECDGCGISVHEVSTLNMSSNVSVISRILLRQNFQLIILRITTTCKFI